MILNRWRRGRLAEKLAARYLVARGMKILARNRRHRRGEIDLIGRQDGVLCIVEVRSRGERSEYLPEMSLTPAKVRRLRAGAEELTRKYRMPHVPVRLDLLVVDWVTGNPEFRYYPGGITAPTA
jgi:putative endonuclease